MSDDELEAQRKVQQLEQSRARAVLRAEVWARSYVAEFTALRSSAVRDTQEVDAVRKIAANVANAVAADFDQYCREHLL